MANNEYLASLANRVGAKPPTDPRQWAWQGLDQNYKEDLNKGWQTWQGMPDFKGKHELANVLYNQYAQMLNRWQNEGPIDYSGSSQVGDHFNNQRARLQDRMAAGGFSGSGVALGAESMLGGQQATAMGRFYREAAEQRRRERLAQQMEFDRYSRALQAKGLERNWEKQDDPGFWGDIAGIAGGVAGSFIPGAGSLFGGGNRQPPPGYGSSDNWSGYAQGGYYGPGY